jgi:hypothetical protein
MISLKEKKLVVNGVSEDIIRWEIWWMTPYGLVGSLDSALHLCPDELMIRPVCVAISEKGYEVCY